MISVQQWLAAVGSMEGVRVRHQGQTRTSGVDCSGMIIAALNECGADVERPFLNGAMPLGSDVTAAMRRFATQLRTPRLGCVVQTYIGREPRHLGVFVGSNQAGERLWMHAQGKKRRVVRGIMPTRTYCFWWLHAVEEVA